MLLIGVVLFYKVSLQNFFLLSRGWLRVLYALSPTLFLKHINGLLCEIKKCPELGVKFLENTMSCLLFADDFVGLGETGSALKQ